MTDKSDPVAAMERLAKAIEAHPEAPFSDAERDAIKRVTTFFVRLDALVWWWGPGKWLIAGLIFVVTQWERIARVAHAWGGQ